MEANNQTPQAKNSKEYFLALVEYDSLPGIMVGFLESDWDDVNLHNKLPDRVAVFIYLDFARAKFVNLLPTTSKKIVPQGQVSFIVNKNDAPDMWKILEQELSADMKQAGVNTIAELIVKTAETNPWYYEVVFDIATKEAKELIFYNADDEDNIPEIGSEREAFYQVATTTGFTSALLKDKLPASIIEETGAIN